MTGLIRQAIVVLVTLVVIPAAASAQGAITGSRPRYLRGGPARCNGRGRRARSLIEKVRSVVTDGSGQYRIVDLRPGTYTVTFTLPGFSPVKREGIELTGSFTATVNADLRVGALEETITVTGESPIVDVQSVTQQRVIGKDVSTAMPTGRSPYRVAVLIPGITSIRRRRRHQQPGASGTMAIHGGSVRRHARA